MLKIYIYIPMKLLPVNVPLLLPEYGRNVQTMVNFLLTIEDRDQRNSQAKMVVATMANVYPHARRDTPEFRNMLYDHLYMISNFELDIDCPFDKPDVAQFSPTPEPLEYSQQYVIQKQYGALSARFAREISLIQDEAIRTELGISLARFMRQKSYDFNHEYPSSEVVIADLYDMTNGKVKLEPTIFDGAQLNTPFRERTNKPQNNRGAQNNRQNRNGGNNGNNNRKKR